MLLLGIFIFAYFKFTWSLRQLNLLSILIGAAPPISAPAPAPDIEKFSHRMGTINTLSGDEFNRAIRAYYFGLATLCWFIQPWLFIFMTAIITLVLYRRDFLSNTLSALRD